ncbi:Ovate protein family C-terminal protein [Dioscorea alata]|uniref:Ovate protein family C-terminal protein n=1 Tax=Dioscorea alata TaxID=55571 RepID=A0ACB7UD56_DIOAL|nr:Ovate protein family C-terminal protein [Dioscorea alata]
MMEKNKSNNMSKKLKKRFAWIFNGSRLLQTTCTTTLETRSRRWTLASIHFSMNCSSCCKNTKMPCQTLMKEKKIKEDTGGCGDREGRTCPPASPASLPSSKKKKKLLLSNGYGFTSSSSSDNDEELADIFSSEEYGDIWKEELETLLSSKSFSSDSSEFYQRPSSIANKKKNIYKHKIPFYGQKVRKERLEENDFAVVKRSEDPYGDFKSSMVEMIVEKQIMFSEEELEKLLKSYLLLNSYHHHPVILRAFSDIWEALFVN